MGFLKHLILKVQSMSFRLPILTKYLHFNFSDLQSNLTDIPQLI